jgi:hypothetical protein
MKSNKGPFNFFCKKNRKIYTIFLKNVKYVPRGDSWVASLTK